MFGLDIIQLGIIGVLGIVVYFWFFRGKKPVTILPDVPISPMPSVPMVTPLPGPFGPTPQVVPKPVVTPTLNDALGLVQKVNELHRYDIDGMIRQLEAALSILRTLKPQQEAPLPVKLHATAITE